MPPEPIELKPERLRELWALIAMTIALDERDTEGYQDGARMALDFALMDDPPRSWPEGGWGHPSSLAARAKATNLEGDQDAPRRVIDCACGAGCEDDLCTSQELGDQDA